MKDEHIFIEKVGENISKTKKIVNEISSLLKEFNKTNNPEEQRMISSQVEKLRKMLEETSQKTINSAEKVSLFKPLNKDSIPSAPVLTAPVFSNIQLQPQQSMQPSKKLKNPKPTPLEKISLKKRKMGEAKVVAKKEKKPSRYVNLANKYFYNFSNSLIKKGKFLELGRNIVKSNMEFVTATYVSVIFFLTLISFIAAIFITAFFLFFNISTASPFIIRVEEAVGARFLKVFWILFAVPAVTFFFAYFYPSLEKRSLESKINQELPFATIHMSAITSSMIEPSKIFSIIIATREYPYLEKEFIKLQNEINIYGYDLVTTLRNRSANSPSRKLSELYNGLMTTITSGGDIPEFFDKRSQTLLFEHRLDVEKQSKAAETFMDIYISVVIAAPMILMLLLMMMRISGFGITLSPFMITLVMILSVTMINIMFLTFLHLKQPKE